MMMIVMMIRRSKPGRGRCGRPAVLIIIIIVIMIITVTIPVMSAIAIVTTIRLLITAGAPGAAARLRVEPIFRFPKYIFIYI